MTAQWTQAGAGPNKAKWWSRAGAEPNEAKQHQAVAGPNKAKWSKAGAGQGQQSSGKADTAGEHLSRGALRERGKAALPCACACRVMMAAKVGG